MNPIIGLERPPEKIVKKGEYKAIKCHNTPGDNDIGSYEIKIPYYGGGSPVEWKKGQTMQGLRWTSNQYGTSKVLVH